MLTDRRSIAPVVGVVLVAFGALLLLQAAYPTADWPRTAFAVVAELVSASVWAITLYIGTILTLLAIPGLLGLGIGLLVAAVRRAIRGEGFGWEALVGAALLLTGWSCVLDPPVGGPFVPIVLVAIGAGLLAGRAAAGRDTADDLPIPATDR